MPRSRHDQQPQAGAVVEWHKESGCPKQAKSCKHPWALIHKAHSLQELVGKGLERPPRARRPSMRRPSMRTSPSPSQRRPQAGRMRRLHSPQERVGRERKTRPSPGKRKPRPPSQNRGPTWRLAFVNIQKWRIQDTC